MTLFQDPEFIQNQYAGNRDISSETDDHVHLKTDDPEFEEDVFADFEDDEEENEKINELFANYEDEDDEEDSKDQNITQIIDSSDEIEQRIPKAEPVASQEHSNDDLDSRAHGALNEDFDELGDDKVAELVERLKVGLWVDLFQADGNQVRAKIMAIVPTVGKYIFGDRGGRKLADFNRQNLTEAIRTRIIRVSEEDNVFDKTLESVIANLRVMKKAEDE